MLTPKKAISCSRCDICRKDKAATLMCTYLIDILKPSPPEEACWCVCDDCLHIVEAVDRYYEDAIN